MSKEAMLTAEVAVLTEMVRVLSDKVNELQAKQEHGEPVAWMRQDGQRVTTASDRHNYPDYETRYSIPLYTTPQKRTWVGLDEEDDIDWEEGGSLRDLVEAVEAKLRSKNNG